MPRSAQDPATFSTVRLTGWTGVWVLARRLDVAQRRQGGDVGFAAGMHAGLKPARVRFLISMLMAMTDSTCSSITVATPRGFIGLAAVTALSSCSAPNSRRGLHRPRPELIVSARILYMRLRRRLISVVSRQTQTQSAAQRFCQRRFANGDMWLSSVGPKGVGVFDRLGTTSTPQCNHASV